VLGGILGADSITLDSQDLITNHANALIFSGGDINLDAATTFYNVAGGVISGDNVDIHAVTTMNNYGSLIATNELHHQPGNGRYFWRE